MIDAAKMRHDRRANRAAQPYLAVGHLLTLVGVVSALIHSGHPGLPRADWFSMGVLAAGLASLVFSLRVIHQGKARNPIESDHQGKRA